MAIDTSMFGVNIPAGSYTKGQQLAMKNIRGPAIVRDGYGAAYLKRIYTQLTNPATGAIFRGHVIVKNSNWDDSVANFCQQPSMIMLAENSSNIQKGHDSKLVVNSGWQVTFVFDETVTTTAAQDAVTLIDVDYPSVQAVQNPREAKGTPVTIMREDAVTINAVGSIESAAWTTFNVDIFKAGYKYLLVEMGGWIANAQSAFVSISGAAGQIGLERIIPVNSNQLATMRYFLDYSTPLVKGPMNINYLPMGTAGSSTAIMEMDWVKA